MGVTNLWTILAPVKEHKPLASLQGEVIAVDLSIWVCENQCVRGMQGVVAKPYLRNLFFRVSHLTQLGVRLVFVIEGDAPQLKWQEMKRRQQALGRGGGRAGKGGRSNFNARLRECCQLLDLLGIPYVHSAGEAEAMCAALNAAGLVDACITDDGDVFLYGARKVYKNFTMNNKDPHVESYNMAAIERDLGISRQSLVGVALLLGCDYLPGGVPGVGVDRVIKYLDSIKGTNLLDRFAEWPSLSVSSCVSKIEVTIRQKSLAVPQFPQHQIIAEFLRNKESVPKKSFVRRRPQLVKAQEFAETKMEWPSEYTTEKVLPLLTLWDLSHLSNNPNSTMCHLKPNRIVKQRVRHGVAVYEVEWFKQADDTASSQEYYVTMEEQSLFDKVYRSLVEDFQEDILAKKNKKKKGTRKKNPPKTNEDEVDDVLSSQLDQLNIAEKQIQKPISIKTGASSSLIADHQSFLDASDEAYLDLQECEGAPADVKVIGSEPSRMSEKSKSIVHASRNECKKKKDKQTVSRKKKEDSTVKHGDGLNQVAQKRTTITEEILATVDESENLNNTDEENDEDSDSDKDNDDRGNESVFLSLSERLQKRLGQTSKPRSMSCGFETCLALKLSQHKTSSESDMNTYEHNRNTNTAHRLGKKTQTKESKSSKKSDLKKMKVQNQQPFCVDSKGSCSSDNEAYKNIKKLESSRLNKRSTSNENAVLSKHNETEDDTKNSKSLSESSISGDSSIAGRMGEEIENYDVENVLVFSETQHYSKRDDFAEVKIEPTETEFKKPVTVSYPSNAYQSTYKSPQRHDFSHVASMLTVIQTPEAVHHKTMTNDVDTSVKLSHAHDRIPSLELNQVCEAEAETVSVESDTLESSNRNLLSETDMLLENVSYSCEASGISKIMKPDFNCFSSNSTEIKEIKHSYCSDHRHQVPSTANITPIVSRSKTQSLQDSLSAPGFSAKEDVPLIFSQVFHETPLVQGTSKRISLKDVLLTQTPSPCAMGKPVRGNLLLQETPSPSNAVTRTKSFSKCTPEGVPRVTSNNEFSPLSLTLGNASLQFGNFNIQASILSDSITDVSCVSNATRLDSTSSNVKLCYRNPPSVPAIYSLLDDKDSEIFDVSSSYRNVANDANFSECGNDQSMDRTCDYSDRESLDNGNESMTETRKSEPSVKLALQESVVPAASPGLREGIEDSKTKSSLTDLESSFAVLNLDKCDELSMSKCSPPGTSVEKSVRTKSLINSASKSLTVSPFDSLESQYCEKDKESVRIESSNILQLGDSASSEAKDVYVAVSLPSFRNKCSSSEKVTNSDSQVPQEKMSKRKSKLSLKKSSSDLIFDYSNDGGFIRESISPIQDTPFRKCEHVDSKLACHVPKSNTKGEKPVNIDYISINIKPKVPHVESTEGNIIRSWTCHSQRVPKCSYTDSLSDDSDDDLPSCLNHGRQKQLENCDRSSADDNNHQMTYPYDDHDNRGCDSDSLEWDSAEKRQRNTPSSYEFNPDHLRTGHPHQLDARSQNVSNFTRGELNNERSGLQSDDIPKSTSDTNVKFISDTSEKFISDTSEKSTSDISEKSISDTSEKSTSDTNVKQTRTESPISLTDRLRSRLSRNAQAALHTLSSQRKIEVSRNVKPLKLPVSSQNLR